MEAETKPRMNQKFTQATSLSLPKAGAHQASNKLEFGKKITGRVWYVNVAIHVRIERTLVRRSEEKS